jgi:3-hydroxyacyl-CoA dehydrogenase/3-hydroxy-2-methylbutyryl-CoA dehydrogenase
MKIENSGIIITGGASGLGLASAKALRDAGAKVGVIDLQGPGGWDGPYAAADVTDQHAVSAALDTLQASVGLPRAMLNAAGGGGGTGLSIGDDASLTIESFKRGLLVNGLGSYIMTRLIAERMLETEPDQNGERGILINVSSIVAQEGQIGTPGYAAGKGAVESMTLPLAREFARYGIRVMTIAPGIYDTPMFNAAREDVLAEMNAGLRAAVQFPARPGYPEEFALAVKYVIENPMMNGNVMRVDGAYRVPVGDHAWWTRLAEATRENAPA